MTTTKARKPRKGLDLVDAPPATNGHANAVQTSAPPPAKDRYEPAMPLDKISPSRTNPRKTFDEGKIAELAESIKTKGVLLPLLVRPLPTFLVRQKPRTLLRQLAPDEGEAQWEVVCVIDGREEIDIEMIEEADAKAEAARLHERFRGKVATPYELIAGERRYRAAKLAGVATVPVRILELSDDDALEVQVIENLQREDLDPVEEAEGFQQLLGTKRYNAESLAVKLSKSQAYVYGALKLLMLPEQALQALRAGNISRSIAQLVGRIPNAQLREEATREILGIDGNWRERPRTVQEAKEFVEQNYMVELKGCPFDPKDASLTPAGPCTTCPARTGNARQLFPDARADVCTDPACFREKVKAAGERRQEEARDSGRAVLDDAEKYFNTFESHGGGHHLRYDAPWVDLGEKCHHDAKNRTYAELLGAKGQELSVVAVDPGGQAHDLVPKKFAEQILVEKKILTAGGRSTECSKEDGKRKADEKIKAETFRRLQAEAVKKSGVMMMSWLGAGPAFMRPLTALLLDEFWSEVLHKVNARRGSESLQKLVATLDPRECVCLLVELAVAKQSVSHDQAKAKDLFAALKLDQAAVEKEVRKEFAAKAKGKKGAKSS